MPLYQAPAATGPDEYWVKAIQNLPCTIVANDHLYESPQDNPPILLEFGDQGKVVGYQ